MRYLLILLSIEILGLTGCGTTQGMYGLPQAQWEKMTETEHQAIIEQFEKQEKNNAKIRTQADKAKQEGDKTKKEAERFAQKCRDEPSQCHVITRQRWGF